MVLLALTLATQASTLPVWTYAYDLPEQAIVIVNGVIQPAPGSGGGGFGGGGASAAAAPPPPLRLADLVSGISKPSAFGIGDRLDRTFLGRAERSTEFPYFSVQEGGATIAYILNATNRVQIAMSTVPVAEAESEARFAASRARLQERLGAPIYGRRVNDESLYLAWQRPDRSLAILTLSHGDEEGALAMTVTLTDGTVTVVNGRPKGSPDRSGRR